MTLRQIKPQKSSQIIIQQLKQQIETGFYPLGSRLPSVVEFATGFEVGRSTVREALSALRAMGFIDIRHGGGTFVCNQLPNDNYHTESFQEIVEVRKFIESGCASLAAKNRTSDDLAALRNILDHMESVLTNEQLAEQADVQFHLQISIASHNTLLMQMMASITQRLQESMKDSRKLWFFTEHATARNLFLEHVGIYDAIFDSNEALASKRILKHIAKVDSVLRKLL